MSLVEIERKFLVKTLEFKEMSFRHTRIIQGFLSKDPKRTVRIRIKGEKGYITVKGLGNESRMTRFEWEREIKIEEAKALLSLCLPGKIDKVRFEIKAENHTFEVDEFGGENQGLIMAEIELKSENDSFTQPEWLGREVTGDFRYYNSYLSDHPFKEWS